MEAPQMSNFAWTTVHGRYVKTPTPVSVLHLLPAFPRKNSSFHTDFGVLGTAADRDGSIAKVEISVDNGPWQLCQNTDSWACSASTAGLAKGKHLLTARATDNVGKVGFDSLTFMMK